MVDLKNIEKGKLLRIGTLFIIAILFIGCVFLPWVQVEVLYEGSQFQVEHSLKISGVGIFESHNSTDFTNTSSFSSSTSHHFGRVVSLLFYSLPSIIGSGILLFMAFRLIFSDTFTNFFEQHSLFPKNFLTLTGKNLYIPLAIGVVNIVTSAVYFFHYLQLPLSPIGFSSLYKYVVEAIEYSKNVQNMVGAVRMNTNVALGPGIGPYLSFFLGVVLLYFSFIIYLERENWPAVWKKRVALLPIIILSTFLPWGEIVRINSGRMFLGGNIPLFGIPFGGVIFFLLGCGLFVINTIGAKTSKHINSVSQTIYRAEEISDRKVSELKTEIENNLFKMKIIRITVFLLLFAIFLFSAFNISSLMKIYQISTEKPSILLMFDGLGGWIAFFGSLADLVIHLIFRH